MAKEINRRFIIKAFIRVIPRLWALTLGKTPVSLAFAERHDCDKILIITINSKAIEPETVPGSWLNWTMKIDKPFNIRTKKSSRSEFTPDEPEVFIVNYEALCNRKGNRRSQVELKDNVMGFILSCTNKKVCIIIDESHKMKDSGSLQTKAINLIKKQLRLQFADIHTYLCTGSPFTSGFEDLYSQLKFLGYEETKSSFLDKFCVRGNIFGLLPWQQPIVDYQNLPELYDLVHHYAVTMKSTDVIDLPEQVFVEHPLPVSNTFAAEAFERLPWKQVDKISSLHGIENPRAKSSKNVSNPFYRNLAYPETTWLAETPAAFWLRCRQASIGFQGNAEAYSWYDRSRLEALRDFLTVNEDNYLIFINYTPELFPVAEICVELGYNVDIYTGSIKTTFFYEKYQGQTEGQRLMNKKNVIIANFASGSTGMNWQLYDKCIVFSTPLYKDWEQGIKRLHRIGQKNTVVYHLFYQDNWLDKGMQAALKEKQDYNEEMFEHDLEVNNTCE